MSSYDHKNDWFYEGNISKVFVDNLKRNGHNIIKDNSDNISAKGVDIISENGEELYLTEVKGYPTEYYVSGEKKGKKKKTDPKLQAKHWFGEALLSCMFNYGTYKKKYPTKKIKLSVVLPKKDRYEELIDKVSEYFKDLCVQPISIYLVEEDGTISKVR